MGCVIKYYNIVMKRLQVLMNQNSPPPCVSHVRIGLQTPDALLAAAAKTGKVDALVTNDRHLRRAEKDGAKVMLPDELIEK